MNSFVEVLLPNIFIKRIRQIGNNVVLFHEFVDVRFDFVVGFLSIEELLGNCELVCDKSEADERTDIRSPLFLWFELSYQMTKHPAKDFCCVIKPFLNSFCCVIKPFLN